MAKCFVIRYSNAAPAWPHELTIRNVDSGGSITSAYGAIERLMWKLSDEYTKGDVIEFERITCRVEHIRTE